MGIFRWIAIRAHIRLFPHHRTRSYQHISFQRKLALFVTVFAVVRTAFWLAFMIAQLTGLGFVHTLVNNVSFVAFISLYANFATELGTATAGLAATFSSEAHQDVHTVVHQDLVELRKDIAELARMQPGDEGERLAGTILSKLAMSNV